MKLLFDTANTTFIKSLLPTGLIAGITTNPTILSEIEQDPRTVVQEIATLVAPHPVSVEAMAEDPDILYKEARFIAEISQNIIVKIPCHPLYYATIKKLATERVPLNITLIASASQALFMQIIGVSYISVFISRAQAAGYNIPDLLTTIMGSAQSYEATKVIAASIHTEAQFQYALEAHTDYATINPSTFSHFTNNAVTIAGIERFKNDWNRTHRSLFT